MTKPSQPKLPTHLETRNQIGEKLVSPSASRNSQVIGQQLDKILPIGAHVLEIASGTGQHGAFMCALRPDIYWQMSDIDDASRQSQNAYAQEFQMQMPPSLPLNMMDDGWADNIVPVDVIYCANMIHIAPWQAALGVAKSAETVLKEGGRLCLYGPFLKTVGSASSNVEFDKSLKTRNPEWGVRNLQAVKHIFADSGLSHCTVIEMPRDNFFLVFK
ncbi:MAG: DUF938 domain-containing protein [Robiginitomaculum sp.]|nr:DUF938 domain-containing protein [Robiginitomaculum sp.]